MILTGYVINSKSLDSELIIKRLLVLSQLLKHTNKQEEYARALKVEKACRYCYKLGVDLPCIIVSLMDLGLYHPYHASQNLMSQRITVYTYIMAVETM